MFVVVVVVFVPWRVAIGQYTQAGVYLVAFEMQQSYTEDQGYFVARDTRIYVCVFLFLFFHCGEQP